MAQVGHLQEAAESWAVQVAKELLPPFPGQAAVDPDKCQLADQDCEITWVKSEDHHLTKCKNRSPSSYDFT